MLTYVAPVPVRTPVTGFRTDIEGLRAIAVLAVALWHADIPGIPGGFTGVDVFFVLSGYLITGMLLAEYDSSAHIDLINFYARRARRLLPASALMLIVTVIACAFLLAPQELYVTASSGRAAALYLSNVWFAGAGAAYFAQAGPGSPFVHTWSLAVEEQFYLVWPVLMLLALRFGKTRVRVASVLGILTILSFVACLFLTYKSPKLAFYHSPLRAWQFGIGGLAVMLRKDSIPLPRPILAVLGWAGLVGILASVVLLDHAYYPGWRGLLPACATALVLMTEAPPILSVAPLQWLGGLSYSWYLWHWPILSLAEAVIRPLTIGHKLAAVTAALILAAVTHRIVENPVRFSRFLSARPIFTLAAAAAVTAVSFGVATGARRYSAIIRGEPSLAAFAVGTRNVAGPPARCIPPTHSATLIPCSLGSPEASRHVVLFGDSHAMHLFPPLEEITASHGWKLTPLARPGCPSTDARRDHSWIEDVCVSWREQAFQWIAASRPDLVVISNITPTGGPRGFHMQDKLLDTYREGLRRTLVRLAGAGTQVLLVRDSPHEHFDVPSCLARSARNQFFPAGACRMSLNALQPEFLEADRYAASDVRGIRYVDLSSEYCPGQYCDVQRGTLLMYRDQQHLTRGYSMTLAPRIESELTRVLAR